MNETINNTVLTSADDCTRDLLERFLNGDYKNSVAGFIIEIQRAYFATVGTSGIVYKITRNMNTKVSVIQKAFFQELVDYLTTDYDTEFNKFLYTDKSKPTISINVKQPANAKVHKTASSELETILQKGGIQTALILLILLKKYY